MVANGSPEDLPAGWTALSKVLRTGREVTIYRHLETGKRCFSKDDLFKYIKAEADKQPPPTSKDTGSGRDEESNPSQVSCEESVRHEEVVQPESTNEKDEVPEWLPDGWRVEVRHRKSGALSGKEYKCYIDPLKGGKFYSKLEVVRYLETIKPKNQACKDVTVNDKNSVLEKKTDTILRSANQAVVEKCEAEDLPSRRVKDTNITQNASGIRKDPVVIEKYEDEDLPSGWIKEIKITRKASGIRKDPFYTDPVSGYVFRSKRDALNYVQTGEISKSAFKPKSSPSSAPEPVKDEISTPSADKRQKLNPPIRRQLSSGKKGSERSELKLSSTKISSAKVSPEARVTASLSDKIDAETHPVKNNSSLSEGKEEVSEKSGGKKAIVQNKKSTDSVPEKVSAGKSQVSSRKSIDKKVQGVPARSSKRLAGHEPEKVANLELGERALVSSIKKSRTETVQEQEAKSAGSPSSKKNIPVDRSPSTKPAEEANKDTEASLSFLFDSDPCLEFAFKTLTGELPVGDSSVNGPNEPTPINTDTAAQHDNFLGKATENQSPGKSKSTRSKPKSKKEPSLPRRSSKRLAKDESESTVNPLTSESNLQNPTTHDSCSTSPRSLTEKTNYHAVPVTMAELANQLFTNSVERPNKRERSIETPAAQEEQPQPCETGKAQPEIGNTEMVSDLSFSIADYWSDPCLDFAFKTLTGVIPVEDSLAQNYFEEQVGLSNNSCGTIFPDFGTSSLFQTDVPPGFGVPEESTAGIQGSATPSFSCSGVHSQQQSIDGNKVKS